MVQIGHLSIVVQVKLDQLLEVHEVIHVIQLLIIIYFGLILNVQIVLVMK